MQTATLHQAATAAGNGSSAAVGNCLQHSFQVKVAATGAFSVTVSPRHSLNDKDPGAGATFPAGAQTFSGTDSGTQVYTAENIATGYVSCPITAISGTGTTVEIIYGGGD